MVQNDVLSKISSDKLKVYIVWTPVLGGDNREAAVDSTKLVYDPRAEHFWDGDQSLGKSFGAAIELPNDRDLAWDIYFAFDRGVKWDDAMPVPNAWMHQLGYDELHLDGDKLQESVRALVEESESQN